VFFHRRHTAALPDTFLLVSIIISLGVFYEEKIC